MQRREELAIRTKLLSSHSPISSQTIVIFNSDKLHWIVYVLAAKTYFAFIEVRHKIRTQIEVSSFSIIDGGFEFFIGGESLGSREETIDLPQVNWQTFSHKPQEVRARLEPAPSGGERPCDLERDALTP